MSSSVGVSINNPGNLLDSSGSLYPGETGSYASPNGYSYAIFGSLSDGWNALTTWLTNNLGTNPSNSIANNDELTSYYLNGSYNNVTATAANPFPTTYENILNQSTGLGSNTNYGSITPSLLQSLETGIAKGEGTFGAFGAAPLPGATGGGTGIGATATSNSGFVSAVESDLANASDYVAALGTSLLGGNTTPTAAQGPNNAGATAGATTGAGVASTASSVGQAVQTAATNVLAPIEKSISTFITGFEGGIENAFARGGFGIVGVILLFAGIFFLAANTNAGKSVGRAVAAGAA